MEVVWQFIGERCGHPRWHEVIRLLIGSLEKKESQTFLLKKVLDQEDEADFQERAILAGGCLLDHVPSAEDMAAGILRGLLLAAVRAPSRKALQNTLAILPRFRSESRNTGSGSVRGSFPGRREPGCHLRSQPRADPGRFGLVR